MSLIFKFICKVIKERVYLGSYRMSFLVFGKVRFSVENFFIWKILVGFFFSVGLMVVKECGVFFKVKVILVVSVGLVYIMSFFVLF